MNTSNTEQCHAFRHLGGTKHPCHRGEGHRGNHHADSGLTWGRHPHNRRMRMGDDPCPDCEPAGQAPRR